MIVVTLDGARLLDGREDWRLLQALVLGIAIAAGYPGTEAGGALSYLLDVDPPRDATDAVVWAWTDEPVQAQHVTRPTVPVAARVRRVAA